MMPLAGGKRKTHKREVLLAKREGLVYNLLVRHCTRRTKMRLTFLMRCSVCNSENYLTEKNRKKTTDRLELMKFCPKCRKQTLHREKTKR